MVAILVSHIKKMEHVQKREMEEEGELLLFRA